MTITGLGPHGERAAPVDLIELSETDIAAARKAEFRVVIVLHTTASDWAKRQVAGIQETFVKCETTVIEVSSSSGTRRR